MKITLSIPDDMLKSIEDFVHSRGTTLSALFTEAVRTYLLQHNSDEIPTKHIQVCLEQIPSVDPERLEEQRLSLLKEEWRICG
jgi:metal-responsive CopG/Arc/MetJ family transcriptional regulator